MMIPVGRGGKREGCKVRGGGENCIREFPYLSPLDVDARVAEVVVVVAGWAVVVSTPGGRRGPRKAWRHPRRPCIPAVRILGSWRAPPATAVTRPAPQAARAASKSNYLRSYSCYLNWKESSAGGVVGGWGWERRDRSIRSDVERISIKKGSWTRFSSRGGEGGVIRQFDAFNSFRWTSLFVVNCSDWEGWEEVEMIILLIFLNVS